MPLKRTVSNERMYKLCISTCIYVYTCFVSIKQRPNTATQLKFPITFDSTFFFNSLYVLYAFCLPFEFLWFFFSSLRYFCTCIHLHFGFIQVQCDEITLCPSFVFLRLHFINKWAKYKLSY